MTQLETLYSIRRSLVPQRQPRLHVRMEELQSALSGLTQPADHPFELSASQYQELSGIQLFTAKPMGHECIVADSFLYRLSPLEDLMRFSGWDLLSRGEPGWSMHRKFLNETAKGKWQP